jgi:citrate synthase
MTSSVMSQPPENFVDVETKISKLALEEGLLLIRGCKVEELAAKVPFENVVKSLWDGESSPFESDSTFQMRLGDARMVAFRRVQKMPLLMKTDVMSFLRAAVAQLRSDAETLEEQFLFLTAVLCVFSAGWVRSQNAKGPILPEPELDHTADFLQMITGQDYRENEAKALDSFLIAACDHGIDTSALVTRAVASTGADAVSAITAALCAVNGPLHETLNGEVILRILGRFSDGEDAENWLNCNDNLIDFIDIAGMKTSVYKTRDPRAIAMENAILQLERTGHPVPLFSIAQSLETRADEIYSSKNGAGKHFSSFQYYAAVLLNSLGIPTAVFPAMFTMARVAGWCGHYGEQIQANCALEQQ